MLEHDKHLACCDEVRSADLFDRHPCTVYMATTCLPANHLRRCRSACVVIVAASSGGQKYGHAAGDQGRFGDRP